MVNLATLSDLTRFEWSFNWGQRRMAAVTRPVAELLTIRSVCTEDGYSVDHRFKKRSNNNNNNNKR